MLKMKSQLLLLICSTFMSISQFGKAQMIDTAYFLNATQPFMILIEGHEFNTNTHISRVVKSTNGADSVIIDLYWKHCNPAFNTLVPFDTTILLDFVTPSEIDVRINSYRDTNTNSSCYLSDSLEFFWHYDLSNHLADLDNFQSEEKQLMKVYTLMGNETHDTSNTLLIYIYSDGTRKKVFRVN